MARPFVKAANQSGSSRPSTEIITPDSTPPSHQLASTSTSRSPVKKSIGVDDPYTYDSEDERDKEIERERDQRDKDEKANKGKRGKGKSAKRSSTTLSKPISKKLKSDSPSVNAFSDSEDDPISSKLSKKPARIKLDSKSGTSIKNKSFRKKQKEIEKEHLEYYWRSKQHKKQPEFMSKGRIKLEENLCPLIKLLDIRLKVIDSTEEKHRLSEDADSDNEMSTKFTATIEEEDEEEKVDMDGDSDMKPSPNQLKLDSKPIKIASGSGVESHSPINQAMNTNIAIDETHEPSTCDEEPIMDDNHEPSTDDNPEPITDDDPNPELITDDDMYAGAIVEEPDSPPTLTIANTTVSDDDSLAREEQLAELRAVRDYPRMARTRPKFEIVSAEQDLIGRFDLGSGHFIPASINRFIRDYQREGIQFLHRQLTSGKGGLLGDDMGLGKTIQVIGLLAAVMDKKNSKSPTRKDKIAKLSREERDDVEPENFGKTCLIVCPAAVLYNWKREFEVWGYFEVGVYDGKDKKGDILYRFKKGFYDIVIASIETVRNEISKLDTCGFTIIVLDEAHRAKNGNSKTNEALHQFNSKLRFALTGTAIQNNYSELWAILDWCDPGALGTLKQWDTYISKPLMIAQDANEPDYLVTIGRERALALARKLLPLWFLRRTKDVIADSLPKKQDHIVFCPLTPVQLDAYKKLLQYKPVQDIIHNKDPCYCGETDDDGNQYTRGSCCGGGWSKNTFKYIALFQKVSNHLALIYPDNAMLNTDPARHAEEVDRLKLIFPRDNEMRRKGAMMLDQHNLCGKWKVLEKLFDTWEANGDKVLIFSASLQILAIVKGLMKSRMLDERWKYLDGSTPAKERLELVDSFNTDKDVFAFLISTKAGGVGLNLTAANKVVIFDPNWNPSHDLQAMDRAYRFGQKRDVDVYRLIGAGTLEELIYNRQQYKRAQAGIAYDAVPERRMFTGVQGDKDNQGDLFGVKNIFTLRESSLTKYSIEACTKAELEWAAANMENLEGVEGIGGVDLDDESGIATEKSQQTAAEKMIAEILAGTVTVISDATLGASKVESEKLKIAAKKKIISPRKSSPKKSIKGTQSIAGFNFFDDSD